MEKPAGRTIRASAYPPFACLHACIQYQQTIELSFEPTPETRGRGRGSLSLSARASNEMTHLARAYLVNWLVQATCSLPRRCAYYSSTSPKGFDLWPKLARGDGIPTGGRFSC